MSRLASAVLTMTILAGMGCVIVSEARAAPAFCDVATCLQKKCRGARGNRIPICNSWCQIDVADNKKNRVCR